jgi:two-component system, NtrC family, sensor kinase
MGRRAKPSKVKAEAKRPLGREAHKKEPAKAHELEKRLAEAIEQQTATSEILGVISRSPTDTQPVFDAIVRSAVGLCNGAFGIVLRYDRYVASLVAGHNVPPEGLNALGQLFPGPATPDSAPGRALLSRAVVHIHDQANNEEFTATVARAVGFRTNIAVPMLRHGQPIGAIAVARRDVQPFSEAEIQLLKTFADQAVIAIENVRLFKELETRNRDLTKSLEQQTATSEILGVISQSPTDVQPVFDTIVRNAVRLCGAVYGGVYRFDGELIHLAANHNFTPDQLEQWHGLFPRPPVRNTPIECAIRGKSVVRILDVEADRDFEFLAESLANQRARGVHSLLIVPMLRHNDVIGAISVTHRQVAAFSDADVNLLKTFADQAVIAIENVRLFTELQERNRAVTEALEQQTATAEILRVISRSPSDLEPVFDTIVRSAVELCGAAFGGLHQLDGGGITLDAQYGVPADELALLQRDVFPLPMSRESATGRAMLDRTLVHIRDIREDAGFRTPRLKTMQSYRTILAVPMIREGIPIGALALWRREVQPFSESEIGLVETFADQAVIAIENVRLFKELQDKNRALTEAHAQVTESLEQQTATSEILRVISSSPIDVHPVFDAIAQSGRRLCDGNFCTVVRYDGELLHLAAYAHITAQGVEAMKRNLASRPSRAMALGRAILDGGVVLIPDVLADAEYDQAVAQAVQLRSVIAVPMLRDGTPIGALSVSRAEMRPFTETEIALLQTFADQAVIAVENVRLFKELQQRTHELEAASRHKSEFLANMSHELRTPLNAVIGFSEVLTERMFGELNEKQDEYVKDIYASGTHLLSLINDILDLSKIEAGRMELELADFHLPQAIENALVLVRERALRRGITLEQSIDPRLGEIRGDERKVKQILLNLLSNAIKFTPEDGRIEMRAKPVNGAVEVSVSDTGVGIAPEDQQAIFEEFRQVGTAAKKVEGTGLGLALSRKFIELHGGRIWVTSEVGAGSTFTFTIPVRRGE